MGALPDFVTSDGPDAALGSVTAGTLGSRLSGCSNPDDDLDTDAMAVGRRAGHAGPSCLALTASPATAWPVSRPSSPSKGGWHGSAEDR